MSEPHAPALLGAAPAGRDVTQPDNPYCEILPPDCPPADAIAAVFGRRWDQRVRGLPVRQKWVNLRFRTLPMARNGRNQEVI
jgi:hypothetical protein